MTTRTLAPLFALLLTACGAAGQAGDPCETTDDCADGLTCHEHEEDGEKVCEAEDEHDHDDHDSGDHDE
jgi:hypothetical protein